MIKKPKQFPGLYYITHRDNLPSIFKHGVLSHNEAKKLPESNVKTIYDQDVVDRRGNKPFNGNSLWDFANFYFQPRNHMLYRVHYCEKRPVAVLHLKNKVFNLATHISIGNAAKDTARITDVKSGFAEIQTAHMQKMLTATFFNTDTERLIMSELLVPERVPPEYIDTIYVPDEKAYNEIAGEVRTHIIPQPYMFFGNIRQNILQNTKIKLIDGDMFFSGMQTLTISVNTVGVMGKGLAARARDAFPHLNEEFQKRCNTKELTTDTPYLYKDAYSFDEHLADSPETMKKTPNSERRFLLFATKQDWRNPSKLEYLHSGLQWLVENAAKSGIDSLAMPALGCGLGGLRWDQAGPVMCKYLRKLNIPCEIYLPQEHGKKIPDAQLSAEFLLGENGN